MHPSVLTALFYDESHKNLLDILYTTMIFISLRIQTCEHSFFTLKINNFIQKHILILCFVFYIFTC